MLVPLIRSGRRFNLIKNVHNPERFAKARQPNCLAINSVSNRLNHQSEWVNRRKVFYVITNSK
jgi:hypothetical protein